RLVTVVAIHVAVAGVAHAKVATTCYAGTDESGDAHFGIVVVRELDRDAREMRTRHWQSNAPHRAIEATYAVSADGRTFDVRSRGLHASGTFEGTPWAWTGYHTEGAAFGGTVISDVRIAGDAMTKTTRFEQGGRVRWRVSSSLTAFDCRELERRRAALDDAAPDAVRTCFEGTQTILGDKAAAIVEQIVEKRRIVLTVATVKLDHR